MVCHYRRCGPLNSEVIIADFGFAGDSTSDATRKDPGFGEEYPTTGHPE